MKSSISAVSTFIFFLSIAGSSQTTSVASGNAAPWASGNGAPWEWTTEQRVTERIDVVKAASRVHDFNEAMSKTGRIGANAARMIPGDVIDGRRHPELFMPIELFRLFVNGAFVSDATGRAVYRQARTRLSTQTLPANFWLDLEDIADSYLRTWRAIQDTNQAMARAASADDRERLRAISESQSVALCRQLAAALQESRRRFGPVWFNRFLYESVAPTAVITLQSPSTASELQYVSGGCQ